MVKSLDLLKRPLILQLQITIRRKPIQLYASSASERDKFTTGADVYGYFGAYIESKLRFFLPPQAQVPAKMPWRELDKKLSSC